MSIKKEIAVFKSSKYGYEVVSGKELAVCSDYTQITEFKEIEFEPFPYGVVEKKELDLIEKEIKAELASHNVKIDELEKRKKDLLAIGHVK